jgi:hypothetical protein
VLQQQVLDPPVDALALEVDPEPGPADLQAPVGLGQVAVAGAAGDLAGAPVHDDVDRALAGGLVGEHGVEEAVEVAVVLDPGDEVLPDPAVEGDPAQWLTVALRDRMEFDVLVLQECGGVLAPGGGAHGTHPFWTA